MRHRYSLSTSFCETQSQRSRVGRLQLKCDGTRWHTGGKVMGKLTKWSGQPVLFTLPRNMVYPALLPLMRTPRLPVVDSTDPPGRFKWTRPFRRKTKSGFCACAITLQLPSKRERSPASTAGKRTIPRSSSQKPNHYSDWATGISNPTYSKQRVKKNAWLLQNARNLLGCNPPLRVTQCM